MGDAGSVKIRPPKPPAGCDPVLRPGALTVRANGETPSWEPWSCASQHGREGSMFILPLHSLTLCESYEATRPASDMGGDDS